MTLIRHIEACNNAVLPGARCRVWVAGQPVGWALPAMAAAAAAHGAILDPRGLQFEPSQLPRIARTLAEAGHFRWRAETFDVYADTAAGSGDLAAPIGQIDRGALPAFGIGAVGVHLNGLVGDELWVARRALSKPLDPGKLDHLVAGGVAAGDTIAGTVIKEAAEEAGLPAALAAQAVHAGFIRYAMERGEGLRRDTLHCFDLELPRAFEPTPTDGEVESFELWPLNRVLEVVRDTDDFKFNVNLVLIDLLLRRNCIPAPEAATLRAALTRPA